MRPIQRILTMGLFALVALAGPAAASPACPECDGDQPGNSDCGFSSADAGAPGDNASALADTDLCVGNSDTFEEKGFWAVLSICLSAFLDGITDVIDASVNVFASQHGVDVDATVDVGDEHEDFDESAVGDLDGTTFEVLGDVDASLHEAGVDAHEIVPVGGEDLPNVDEDLCVDLADLGC